MKDILKMIAAGLALEVIKIVVEALTTKQGSNND